MQAQLPSLAWPGNRASAYLPGDEEERHSAGTNIQAGDGRNVVPQAQESQGRDIRGKRNRGGDRCCKDQGDEGNPDAALRLPRLKVLHAGYLAD